VLLSLPEHLTIPFEGTPEEAVVLLLYIKKNNVLRKRYQPWLDALPGPDDFIAWDSIVDEKLMLLQCPGMVMHTPTRSELFLQILPAFLFILFLVHRKRQ
jgi:hypothetical protein